MGKFVFRGSHKESHTPQLFLWAWLLLALSAFGNAPAFAEGDLRLSGFGTFGYARDDTPRAALLRDLSQLPRNGFASDSSWQLDSRLGMQVEYGVNSNIDLVGQMVLRDHFKADFDSSVELAYASIKPQPQLDIRVGRINYDAFLMSDYRNVGYAYTWVRPPSEFYGWIPIFSVNGIDVAYNILADDFQSDDARWRIKAQAGHSNLSVPVAGGINGGYDFTTDDLVSVSVTRQTESWRLKAAHSRFTFGSEVPIFSPLLKGLDSLAAARIPAVSAEAADLRKNLGFDGVKISYTTLGAAYDDGTWLAQGELGYTTSTADVVPHGRMGYLSVGRRLGDWTPFVMMSASRPSNDVRSAANNWGAYNAILRNPALGITNSTRIEQNTATVGVRWDIYRRTALKLQWDRTTIKPSGWGLWGHDEALTTGRVNLLSATLDIMF